MLLRTGTQINEAGDKILAFDKQTAEYEILTAEKKVLKLSRTDAEYMLLLYKLQFNRLNLHDLYKLYA